MKILELYNTVESLKEVSLRRGYFYNSIKLNPPFLNFSPLQRKFDLIFISPGCRYFSIAACSHNWDKVNNTTYIAKRPEAKNAYNFLDLIVKFISLNKPKFFFIENPRGLMRKMIPKFFDEYKIIYYRYTVTYCQYGASRMKPTDFWTNLEGWVPKPICSPRASCHESAPRGSRRGTQGMKRITERAKIPPLLIEEIFNFIERDF